jgi:hypothetical protein
MLADARKDYAFKIIDAAVAPEDRERPNRTIILVLATFGGFSLSLFYAVFNIYSVPMIKEVLGKDESEPLIELESIPFINRLFGKNI